MIRTFSCKKTERLFNREAVKEFATIASAARRRLFTLNNARALADLLIPPGNRLEDLQGDREGEHSIRINEQHREILKETLHHLGIRMNRLAQALHYRPTGSSVVGYFEFPRLNRLRIRATLKAYAESETPTQQTRTRL